MKPSALQAKQNHPHAHSPAQAWALPKGLLLVLLIAVIGLTALFWKNRADQLRQAEINGANLVWVLESRLDAALRRVDADLLRLAAELTSSDLTPARAPLRREQVNRTLAQYLEKFREISRIYYFDADGQLLYSSTESATFNISDREHFRRLRDDASAGLMFSDVIMARTDGKPTVVAGRAIRAKDGRFNGVVAAAIDLEHFSQLFEAVDLGPHGAMAIRRTEDARLVLRRPAMPQMLNQSANYSIRERIVAGETSGVEHLQSPSDGIVRISTFRVLHDYPFYVVLAASRDDVLADWRFQTGVASVVAVALLMFLGFLGRRLARSEENFRTFFGGIDDFLFVLDRSGTIRHVNRLVVDKLGYAENDLVGRNLVDVHPVERQTEVAQLVAQLAGKVGAGPSGVCQVPLLAADGRQIPVETHFVLGRRNGAMALFGVSRDVSERLRYQEALENEASRRRLVLEQSRDGIALLRTDGSVAEFNPAFAAMLGYSPDELSRLHVWDWEAKLNREELEGITQHLGRNHVQIETRHRRKDGTQYEVEVSVSGVELDGESYLFCLHRDITKRKEAERLLRESEASFRNFFEKNSSVMMIIDPLSGKIVSANRAATEFYGYPHHQLLGMSISAINSLPPERVVEEGMRTLRDECSCFNFPHRLASGEVRDVEVYLTPVESGSRTQLFSIVHDVTERKQAEAKLQLAATVFTHAREGIMITAADGTLIDVNETFCRVTGYSRDEVVGRNPRFLKSGLQGKAFYSAMWRALIENGFWYGEAWNRRKNGEMFAVMLTISAVRDAQGVTRQYVALFSDITPLKEQQRELEHMAHYDVLTALPNRLLLADRLQQAMTQCVRRGQGLAVCYLDLDGFKAVNDSHGHETGDRLLIALAGRMKLAVRDGDTLARLGGDEFVAVLIDVTDAETCAPILNRLLEAAAQPVPIGELVLQVSASLGVAFFPQNQVIDAEHLISQADQAMYRAKQAGKNRYCMAAAE